MTEAHPHSFVRLAAAGPIRSAEAMLFLFNHSALDVELEMGQAVAVAERISFRSAEPTPPSVAKAKVSFDLEPQFSPEPTSSRKDQDSIAVATCSPQELKSVIKPPLEVSTRLSAPRYSEICRHLRIAQPWDLKRGAQYDVLVEPGRSLVREIAKSSAVVLEAPDCKTMSRPGIE